MPSSAYRTLRTVFRARRGHRFEDPVTARREFEEFVAVMPGPGEHSTEPGRAGGVPGEWVTTPATTPADPEGSPPRRTLVLLHGGGYVSGSPATHRGLAVRIARLAGARVFQVDYRRAPEDPFPAAFEDGLAATRAVLESAADPGTVAVLGDSAGGGLAVAVTVALRDEGSRLPGALACLSPWTDLAVTGETVTTRADADPLFDRASLERMARLYADGTPLTDPRLSPLYADLHGLPPTLVQVGDAEVLLDDSRRLVERLEGAGVTAELDVWPEMIHGWQLYAGMIPEGRRAIERIGTFVRRALSS